MKPGFYVCGGGGEVNCQFWDDVNGCWRDMNEVDLCPVYIALKRQREIDDEEMDDGNGGY